MNAVTSDPWVRRSTTPKLDRIMVTPEGVPLNVTIASAGARAGALMLDIVIIIAVIVAACSMILLGFALYIAFRRRQNSNQKGKTKEISPKYGCFRISVWNRHFSFKSFQ